MPSKGSDPRNCLNGGALLGVGASQRGLALSLCGACVDESEGLGSRVQSETLGDCFSKGEAIGYWVAMSMDFLRRYCEL